MDNLEGGFGTAFGKRCNMLGANGYRYKKDLKASVGQKLRYIETSMFGAQFKADGRNELVGPDAQFKREWYASVWCNDGVITKVE